MNGILSLVEATAAHTPVERIGWLLLHSVWQFALIALLAIIGLRLTPRRSSAARYWLMISALVMTLLVPPLTWSLIPGEPQVLVTVRQINQTDEIAANDLAPPAEPMLPRPAELEDSVGPPRRARQAESPRRESAAGVTVAMSVGDTIVQQETESPSTSNFEFIRPWLPAVVIGWFIGVVFFSLRPIFGWYTVWRLRSVGVSPVPDSVQRLFDATVARLKIRAAVQIMQSTLVTVPVVVGYMKPLVLLPVSAMTGLPTSQLEAMLAHELAHVRRFDYVFNVLQTLIETVYFYHPAVWWLSRQIRIEREHCCDDVVIATLDNRGEYVRALLAVAELKGSTPAMAMGMSGTMLQVRVRRLCGVEPA
jgi:hypothetical protein